MIRSAKHLSHEIGLHLIKPVIVMGKVKIIMVLSPALGPVIIKKNRRKVGTKGKGLMSPKYSITFDLRLNTLNLFTTNGTIHPKGIFEATIGIFSIRNQRLCISVV